MLRKEKILEIAEETGRFTTKDIVVKFGVSRQYANLLISELVAEKKLIKLGGTRNSAYLSVKFAKENQDLIPNTFKKSYKNKSIEEHTVLTEIEEKFYPLSNLKENIKSIFTFAFSEMFNNAIEHSKSKNITVGVSLVNQKLSFVVKDHGIGVFRNIMKKRNLNSETEAIQDLLKGKTTTMPKSHSGEGIFFTSKASSLFVLDSFGYQMVVEPEKNDVRIKNVSKIIRGTSVTFEINTNSNLHLNEVFRKYTGLTQNSDFGFDKTEIRVNLYTVSGVHISRSQARRILSGLEKFKIIVLDFDRVPIVGQAFADEIYRVFQNSYPDIAIQEENMSEGVRFMIERAKNEAKK